MDAQFWSDCYTLRPKLLHLKFFTILKVNDTLGLSSFHLWGMAFIAENNRSLSCELFSRKPGDVFFLEFYMFNSIVIVSYYHKLVLG